MKLPNFFDFEPLNKLKSNMGIAKDVYGDLTVLIDPSRLSELELANLTSPKGVDILADELTVLSDGTLAYKNSRVLLYIRDYTLYEPRFHLANCATLEQMREQKRFNRYVVSVNTNGSFQVNFIENNISKAEIKRLAVCQNCLNFLALDGFSSTWKKQDKLNYVADFNINRFFNVYPKLLTDNLPKYNSNNAPINIYPTDFNEIGRGFKESVSWICQKCGLSLQGQDCRKWLHTHHINGLKNDNNKENLKVICIRCHANEPKHEHMRHSQDYKDFQKKFM